MANGDETTAPEAETAYEQVTRKVASGVSKIWDTTDDVVTPTSVENLTLLRVGKPTGFSSKVDPHARIKYYMESKMNIIDIIPCDYMIPFTKAVEAFDKNSESSALLDSLTPTIGYGQAVTEYQQVCASYGLLKKNSPAYGGLRLYLTDETTATDDFSNTYTDNWLNSTFSWLTDKSQKMRAVGRSVTSSYDKQVRQLGYELGSAAGEKIGQAGDFLAKVAGKDTGAAKQLSVLGGAVGAAVAAGDRLTLPKLWSDTNYTPNMTAVVKLVSPYGHPDAIKEFIIKPLMFLLIMASPRTRDGISYGHTPKVTVKGYGTTHIPLAHISNISLRKGGADTSYNIYRQPLSIDVSLQFESLVRGFAAFDGTGRSKELNKTDWEKTNDIRLNFTTGEAGEAAFFPTLGTIVDSIRPIAINQIVTRYNVGDLPSTPGLKLAAGDSHTNPTSPKVSEPGKTPSGNSGTVASGTESNSTNQANDTTNQQVGSSQVANLAEAESKLQSQQTG